MATAGRISIDDHPLGCRPACTIGRLIPKVLDQLSKGGKDVYTYRKRLTSFKLYGKICEIDMRLSRDGLSWGERAQEGGFISVVRQV
jgi:hypothetical protein